MKWFEETVVDEKLSALFGVPELEGTWLLVLAQDLGLNYLLIC